MINVPAPVLNQRSHQTPPCSCVAFPAQRPYFVRYGVSKANYGAPFKDRWFRRHDGGVLKPAV
ncbi:hypothetical protein, partial [Aeromonas caviae]|uniref:hypothetical protein n=1 Tax=Aeromonas caviae TaxID=648 RepID=UPI0040399A1A